MSINETPSLPGIERNSFFSPVLRDVESEMRQEKKEKEKQEFTTFYFDYSFDETGKCTIKPQPYETKE